jgi:hypothetical protein
MTTIAVIDGMGGGIGVQIVTQLRQELPLDVEILALGANAVATDRMMQAKASRGASGENAIRVSINLADFILAPIGAVIPIPGRIVAVRCLQFMFAPRSTFSYPRSPEPIDEAIELLPSLKDHRG